MTNKTYNILKSIALIWLPALGTLYAALSGLWGLPFTVQIVGSISAVDTFLGAGLQLSNRAYKPAVDGKLIVDDTNSDGPITANFNFTATPPELIAKKQVIFEVVHAEPPPVRILPPSA